ncbi:uncharacterized protein LOC123548437 [Mercenaria mercenaria]|uniref:uncharacterized protein LOC123548437 n=1 Tax=Mercenaria mercenaria TaxID=6596 RepID=UPI00234E4354|nr:uncharacterized protein LOC123548437 [Mercenaria mercenaria]
MTLERDDNETGVDLASSYGKNECAICLEICRKPKFLPCMHRFCDEPCLQDLLHRSSSKTFNCPLCREEYVVEPFKRVKRETRDRRSSKSDPFLAQPTEMTRSITSIRSSYRGSESRTEESNLDSSHIMEESATRETRATGNRTSSEADHTFLTIPSEMIRSITSSRSSNGEAVSRTVEPNLDSSYSLDMILERDDNETYTDLSRSYGDDKCAICLGSCRNPTFLLCMHRFCEEPCLQNLLHSSQSNTFKCPICRQEYDVEMFECVRRVTGGRTSSESDQFPVQPTEMTRALTSSRSSNRETVESNLECFYSMACSCGNRCGNSCGKKLYVLGIIVGVLHFVCASIARVITGSIILKDHKGNTEVQNNVAAFHLWAGICNFVAALTICCICCKQCCDRFKKCTYFITALAACLLIADIIYFWCSKCNRNDDCGGTFLLSKCYSIVDGIMIVCLIVFGCVKASRNI